MVIMVRFFRLWPSPFEITSWNKTKQNKTRHSISSRCTGHANEANDSKQMYENFRILFYCCWFVCLKNVNYALKIQTLCNKTDRPTCIKSFKTNARAYDCIHICVFVWYAFMYAFKQLEYNKRFHFSFMGFAILNWNVFNAFL